MSRRRALENLSPGVYSSNGFVFKQFRTLFLQWSTFNPFAINHFRTLSRATEGWGCEGLFL